MRATLNTRSSSRLVTGRRRRASMTFVGAVLAVIALSLAVDSTQGDSASAARRRVPLTKAARSRVAVAKPSKPSMMPATTMAGQSTVVTTPGATSPMLGGCPVFPADNPWNLDISQASVHPKSSTWVTSVNASRKTLHPDTGSNPEYGIPFVVVPAEQAAVPVRYTDYGDESDPGPFPIPSDAPIEGGGDRHVLVVQSGRCQLTELFNARRVGDGWEASSGARFDLRSNGLRPAGWTSADAAGLPILPGLLRFDEAASGEIRHALRFTVSKTQRAYILPARHFAGSVDDSLPPMGARFRLRADADLSRYRGQALVILKALQRYGMIVADNGLSWFISGARDARWDDDDLGQLKTVPGAWFEVVETGLLTKG